MMRSVNPAEHDRIASGSWTHIRLMSSALTAERSVKALMTMQHSAQLTRSGAFSLMKSSP